MIGKIEAAIEKYDLIQSGDKIVVAVSGGPDSMALLHSLHTLAGKYYIKLYVCHLNHMLRGLEADEDAEAVKTYCEKLKIPAYIFERDIEAYAKANQMGFEEAAREVRYHLFDYVMKETGANKIAVGQNMNDQAETILMRLFRGAGLEGLNAIAFKRDAIIRPMLGVSRDEIEAYVKENKIPIRIDHTNLETDYTRNKVRLELLPYIREHFNENIISRLYETTLHLQEDADFINNSVETAFVSLSDKNNEMLLNDFISYHVSIQKRVLRKIISMHSGNLKNIGSMQINALNDMIISKKHGAKMLVKDLLFEISYEKLLYYPQVASGLPLTPFNTGQVFQYKNQSVQVIDLDHGAANKHMITIDVRKIQGNLYLRTRLPGDRFAPIGMKGTKKIKDFMIDLKIPAKDRDDILLLCDDVNIIWVVGYRMSELYKIDPTTSESLTIRWHKS